MTKYIVAILILMLLITACGKKAEEQPAEMESQAPATAQAPDSTIATLPNIEQTTAPEPTTSDKPVHKPVQRKPGEIFYLNSTNFDTTIASGRTIVDFWAPWCPPCRQMAPIFEDVAGEVTNVRFAKLNTDDHGQLAQRFGIQSIPTLIVFQDGKEVKRVVGLQTREELLKLVK